MKQKSKLHLSYFFTIVLSCNLSTYCYLCPKFIANKLENRSEMVYAGFFNVISGAEKLLDGTAGGSIEAIRIVMDGSMDLIKVNISDYGISNDSLLRMGMIRDGFKHRIKKLVTRFKRGELFQGIKKENDDLVGGLTALVYNILAVIVEDGDVGSSFSSMLGGAYKIVVSILAENKISSNQLDDLLRAFDAVFSFDEYAMLD